MGTSFKAERPAVVREHARENVKDATDLPLLCDFFWGEMVVQKSDLFSTFGELWHAPTVSYVIQLSQWQ